MNDILYISVENLLNEGIIDYKKLACDYDIKKLSLFVDSVLMNLPVADLVINKDSKSIVIGKETVQYLYYFVNRDVKLCDKDFVNKKWRNKKFSELGSILKDRILFTTIRVICIDEKLNTYY